MIINSLDRHFFGELACRKGHFETRECVSLKVCLYAVDEGSIWIKIYVLY